jgi:hypothetical protein
MYRFLTINTLVTLGFLGMPFFGFGIVPTIPLVARAEDPSTVCGGQFCNPIQYNTIQDFLVAILNAVVLILFPIIVLMLVYCGFLFVRAQGNPTEITKARTIFFWTLVDGLIVLGSEALSLAIAATVSEIQNGSI